MKNRIFLAPNPVKQISSELLKLQGGGNSFLLGREAVRAWARIEGLQKFSFSFRLFFLSPHLQIFIFENTVHFVRLS